MKIQNIVVSSLLLYALCTGLAFADPTIVSGKLSSAFSSWGNDSLSGDWAIVKDGDDHYLELGDNFAAKKGPDVKVFLSPIKSTAITGANAVEGSVFVYLLDSFKGATRIKIPVGTDISKYQSLVFHCEEYSKLWGTSPLQ